MRHPSGENFAAATKSSCFNGPISRFPVESDQTQAVLSTELVRILVPSGETSIADTQPLCPLNSVTFLWLSASHTITLPSHVPLTIHFPSRDAAILKTSHPASIGVPFIAATHNVLPVTEERDRVYDTCSINFDRFSSFLLHCGTLVACLARITFDRRCFLWATVT